MSLPWYTTYFQAVLSLPAVVKVSNLNSTLGTAVVEDAVILYTWQALYPLAAHLPVNATFMLAALSDLIFVGTKLSEDTFLSSLVPKLILETFTLNAPAKFSVLPVILSPVTSALALKYAKVAPIIATTNVATPTTA